MRDIVLQVRVPKQNVKEVLDCDLKAETKE